MSARKRILIVDDDVSLTRMLKLNLEQVGAYDVRIENVPLQAYSAVREYAPDLILLDVMMPGMDGGDLAAQIRGNERLKKIPIVFLTAAVQQTEVKKRGGTIGGFPYLAKPVDTDELLNCIGKNLLPSSPS